MPLLNATCSPAPASTTHAAPLCMPLGSPSVSSSPLALSLLLCCILLSHLLAGAHPSTGPVSHHLPTQSNMPRFWRPPRLARGAEQAQPSGVEEGKWVFLGGWVGPVLWSPEGGGLDPLIDTGMV